MFNHEFLLFKLKTAWPKEECIIVYFLPCSTTVIVMGFTHVGKWFSLIMVKYT
jgi:hypothetical protein